MRELCEVSRLKRYVVEKFAAIFMARIGVIHRKHQTVDPECLQRSNEWWIAEEAGRGDVDLIGDGLRQRAAQIRQVSGELVLAAMQHRRQTFTHMPNDEIQTRV